MNLDYKDTTADGIALAHRASRPEPRFTDATNPEPASMFPPQWDLMFSANLTANAMGYSWVASDGTASGLAGEGIRQARAAQDSPQTKWSINTRMNIASVSKSVTAVAVLRLLRDSGLTVSNRFFEQISKKLGPINPGSRVDTVTIENLLTMKSGLKVDGSLGPRPGQKDIWDFLRAYLQQPLEGTPGVTEAYSNTNFTILQALVESLSGTDYVTFVNDKVLKPMGIDTRVFNASPDPKPSATLFYRSASDTLPGHYWESFPFVAAGGWVSSARELLKFLVGVRTNVVLSVQETQQMFAKGLGWYPFQGVYGTYYHHNGGLATGGSNPAGLSTGIVRFSENWDAVLLVNSPNIDTIGLMIKAFEFRFGPFADTGACTVGKNRDGSLNAFTTDLTGGTCHIWRTGQGTTGWSEWAGIKSGRSRSEIAVGATSSNSLEIFARGSDNRLWGAQQSSPNSTNWNGWYPFSGNQLSGGPACGFRDAQSFVFTSDTNNVLNVASKTSGTWSGLTTLPGAAVTGNLVVARRDDGALDVFARGYDKALWHIWQTSATAWSKWVSLGGDMTSSPAVGRDRNGRLIVFARGYDKALWHISQDPSSTTGWSKWVSLRGDMTSSPACIQRADSTLMVFARGYNNAVWNMWQAQTTTGWSGWQSLGGTTTSAPRLAIRDGIIEVFARGGDAALWHIWQTSATAWSTWASLGGTVMTF